MHELKPMRVNVALTLMRVPCKAGVRFITAELNTHPAQELEKLEDPRERGAAAGLATAS